MPLVGPKEYEGGPRIRMVSQEEPEEGTPNAEADIVGPAQSGVDCNYCSTVTVSLREPDQ